jgi:Protein of unknown function (DUF2933)
MSSNYQHAGPGPNWSRINQWLLWVGLAAAVAWLFLGHRAHLLQLAPFLILLACPLMHIFGHGGHGEHGGHSSHRGDEPPALTKRPGDAEQGHGGHVH